MSENNTSTERGGHWQVLGRIKYIGKIVSTCGTFECGVQKIVILFGPRWQRNCGNRPRSTKSERYDDTEPFKSV